MSDSAPFFPFLDKYPVIPLTVFVTHAIAVLPIICLLYISQIAPLHNNCRYILCVWALSFGTLFAVDAALFVVDFTSETGYMPRSMYEPHIRFKLYQYHVMCTTFCSTFEIVLSVERIISIINPKQYHFSVIAWKTLVTITLSLMVFACATDFCVHSEEMIPRLVGVAILAVVEISILVVKEAHDMSKAMIPAYIISFILKASSISALGAYYAVIREDNGYLTGYVQTFMIMVCVYLFYSISLCCNSRNIQCEEKVGISIPTVDTETYFNLYSNSWK